MENHKQSKLQSCEVPIDVSVPYLLYPRLTKGLSGKKGQKDCYKSDQGVYWETVSPRNVRNYKHNVLPI